MRLVICDGCGDVMEAQHEYAVVNVADGRLDLCYAKCYSHYETYVRKEDELAYALSQDLHAKRAAYLDEFRGLMKGKRGTA